MAKPCRERAFPNKTTVIIFVPRKERPDKDAQPVEALVWLGGTYFEPRSQFAGKSGMPVADHAVSTRTAGNSRCSRLRSSKSLV